MDSESENLVSKLNRKRLESRHTDYMEVLDNMMTSMENYLQRTYRPNWYGRPFANLWEIEYEKVKMLKAELEAQLGLYGKLKGTEKAGKGVEGVFVPNADAQKHLENRNKSKPDQPKAEVDAEREANWLEAALIMQAVQKFVRDSELDDMIEEAYGIKKTAFCGNFQKYIWIFLGQGSDERLPWSQDPKWPRWKISRGGHPDCTKVLDMWHNGVDIYDILEIIGPLGEDSRYHIEKNRKKMETASHGSPGPSN